MTDRKDDELPMTADAPTRPVRDDSARIHRASQDRAFPAKREAAVEAICAAIDGVVTPFGYARKGDTWSRNSTAGRSAVNLQRSRYGWECYVNLRFLTPDGAKPDHGVWRQDDDVRIALFYLPDEGQGPEPGVIFYLDAHDDPACLDEPMQVLRDRALPWLDAHHGGLPTIADFMPAT
jgi:Domain of unknown function (DUF4304)